jgi:hypothetical protein
MTGAEIFTRVCGMAGSAANQFVFFAVADDFDPMILKEFNLDFAFGKQPDELE